MTIVRPLPQDQATPKQHGLILQLVCKAIGEQWWRSPDMTKVAAYLNSTFNLNLDAELEPLSKWEASAIIDRLKSN